MRSNKGVPLTPKHRAKIGEANRRRYEDPELRRQVSERWRALWADPDYRASRNTQTPEEKAAYQREWRRMDYERNPDKYKALARQWREKHPDESRAKAREYARQHPVESRLRVAKWMENPDNRAKANATRSAYLRAHPEVRQKYEAVRRALRRGATVELVDRDVVLARANGMCGWCSEPVDPAAFHVDHIVALVHGGEHSYANTQPVHPACNYEKRTVLKERAA